jgi:hypothetical protein
MSAQFIAQRKFTEALHRKSARCNALWAPHARPDHASLEINDEWVRAVTSSNARRELISLGMSQYPLAGLRVPHQLALVELADRNFTVRPLVDDPQAPVRYLDSDGKAVRARELGILPLELIDAGLERDAGSVCRHAS